MPLLPRRGSAAEPAAPVEEAPELEPGGRKGRPTPKRREAGGGARGPAAPPPRTRKEAYAFQKQQTAKAKAGPGAAGGKPQSREAYREALRRGDPAALPKRDQGAIKALARDYVDSRVMLSNFLLLAFVPLLLGPFISAGNAGIASGLQLATFAILLVVVVEWYFTGRKLRTVARERDIPITGSPLSLGFYAGSRAYLPRRWRLPAPRKARGDDW
ncbi:DUF3043 domain-containing protein [Jatrophihabitans sp. YIM 134969]